MMKTQAEVLTEEVKGEQKEQTVMDRRVKREEEVGNDFKVFP